jgi:hypothetical protein
MFTNAPRRDSHEALACASARSGTMIRRLAILAGFVLALSSFVPVLKATEAPPPTSIDLRTIFANWGLTQRLQGGRGTCSVFTMAGALEYALATQQRRATVLSVEFLNWASNQATTNRDDGSFFSDLWSGFERYGVCAEADMPYQNRFDPNLSPNEKALKSAAALKNAGLRMHWIKPWDVNTGLTDAHMAAIKRALAQQWPVGGGFRWPKQEHWTHQVLDMAPPSGVVDGHSVLLVGFKDDPNQPGGGTFLIRNSGRGQHDAAITYEFARAYMNDAVYVDLQTRPAAR